MNPDWFKKNNYYENAEAFIKFYEDSNTEEKDLIHQFSKLIDQSCSSGETFEEDLKRSAAYLCQSLQKLHSSFQFTHQQGRTNPLDDLFYSDSLAKGLPIPLRNAERTFLEKNKALLDFPTQFVSLIDSIFRVPAMEKELMITMLDRLV